MVRWETQYSDLYPRTMWDRCESFSIEARTYVNLTWTWNQLQNPSRLARDYWHESWHKTPMQSLMLFIWIKHQTMTGEANCNSCRTEHMNQRLQKFQRLGFPGIPPRSKFTIIQSPESLGVRRSKAPEAWFSDHPCLGRFGFPHISPVIRISANPELQRFRFPIIQSCGDLNIRKSMAPEG